VDGTDFTNCQAPFGCGGAVLVVDGTMDGTATESWGTDEDRRNNTSSSSMSGTEQPLLSDGAHQAQANTAREMWTQLAVTNSSFSGCVASSGGAVGLINTASSKSESIGAEVVLNGGCCNRLPFTFTFTFPFLPFSLPSLLFFHARALPHPPSTHTSLDYVATSCTSHTAFVLCIHACMHVCTER